MEVGRENVDNSAAGRNKGLCRELEDKEKGTIQTHMVRGEIVSQPAVGNILDPPETGGEGQVYILLEPHHWMGYRCAAGGRWLMGAEMITAIKTAHTMRLPHFPPSSLFLTS